MSTGSVVDEYWVRDGEQFHMIRWIIGWNNVDDVLDS